MSIIHRILVPVDFLEHSDAAVAVACDLAREYRAELVILHVATVPGLVFTEAGSPPVEDYHEDLWQRLQAIHLDEPGVRVSYRLEEGEPAEEILHTAETTDADLIVMGIHGRSALARFFTGSVAENVVREASCPVLTVKGPKHQVVETATIHAAEPAAD